VVLFGHGFPLPLLAPGLRDVGMPSVVLTHGAEVWMALAPGTATAFRWACSAAREVTAITRYTAARIRTSIPRSVPISLLPPAVDPARFSPASDGTAIRKRLGLEGRKVVLCVSRLVPRKGQDVLLEAMPLVRNLVPDAALALVG